MDKGHHHYIGPNQLTLGVTRSRGGSFIPAEWDKIWGSGHFLGTRTVKQHHLCNIPHILSKRTYDVYCL